MDITDPNIQAQVKQLKKLQASVLNDLARKNPLQMSPKSRENALFKLSSLLENIEAVAVTKSSDGTDVIADWAYNDVKMLLKAFDVTGTGMSDLKFEDYLQKEHVKDRIGTSDFPVDPMASTGLGSMEFKNLLLTTRESSMQHKIPSFGSPIKGNLNKSKSASNTPMKSSTKLSKTLSHSMRPLSMIDLSSSQNSKMGLSSRLDLTRDLSSSMKSFIKPEPIYTLDEVKELARSDSVYMAPKIHPVRALKAEELRTTLNLKETMPAAFKPTSTLPRSDSHGYPKSPKTPKNGNFSRRANKLYKVEYFPHTEGAMYCRDEFHEVLDNGQVVHVKYLPIDDYVPPEPVVEVPLSDADYIKKLEKALKMEQDRLQALLAELQNSHHREMLMNAQMKLMEEKLVKGVCNHGDGTVSLTEMNQLRELLLQRTNERDNLELELRKCRDQMSLDAARIKELEAALAELEAKYQLLFSNNGTFEDEFKRLRDQNAKQKFEFLQVNDQLKNALRDLLKANEELQGLLQQERDKNSALEKQIKMSPQALTTFQKLRVFVHEALYKYFLKKYREEKRLRLQMEFKLEELLNEFNLYKEAKQREIGVLEGKLTLETEARIRAEKKLQEMESKLENMGQLLVLIETLKRDLSDELAAHNNSKQLLAEKCDVIVRLTSQVNGLKLVEANLREQIATLKEKNESLRKENEVLLVRLDAALRQLADLKNQLLSAKSLEIDTIEKGPPIIVEQDNSKYEDLKGPHVMHWLLMCREGFEGDYLDAKNTSIILNHLFENKDNASGLVFCDTVTKVGRSNSNPRMMLLSTKNAFLLDSSARRVARCVSLAELEFISLARSHGDILVLHFKKSEDMFLLMSKRSECLFHLVKVYNLMHGSQLPYKYADRIFVRDHGGVQREIEVYEPQKFRISKVPIVA